MVPHTKKPEVGECTSEDDDHQVYAVHVYVRTVTRMQTELTLITEDNECHSTLQSTLSRHQSNRTWQCRGVSSSLARGTHDVSYCKQTVPKGPW